MYCTGQKKPGAGASQKWTGSATLTTTTTTTPPRPPTPTTPRCHPDRPHCPRCPCGPSQCCGDGAGLFSWSQSR